MVLLIVMKKHATLSRGIAGRYRHESRSYWTLQKDRNVIWDAAT